MSFLQVSAQDLSEQYANQVITMTEDTVQQCVHMYLEGQRLFANKTVAECNSILERLDLKKPGLSGEIFSLHESFGAYLEGIGAVTKVSFPHATTVDGQGQVRAVES